MTSLRRSLSPSIYDRPLQNGTTFSDASLPIAATVPSFNPGFPAAAAATLSLADVSSNGRNYWMADKLKFKGNLWKKPFMHVILCFILGCLVGLTPFSVPKPAMYKPMAQRELVREAKTHVWDKANSFGDRERHSEVRDPPSHSDSLKVMTSLLEQAAHGHQMSDPALSKLLIVVTPTYNRPLQAMYLTRLSHTLKLVPPPLLWLVVEMGSQTVETATLLRNTGLMYRHLVCDKNTSDIKDRGVHQRNVALAHIERHQLDGVVYFADDDNVYTLELFQQMRTIKRFGTWPIAMLTHNKSKTILEGPVCEGHKVIGWHTNEKSKRLRRLHVDMSGFAFNSTILWDPQRWRKPSLEPIRQMDNIKEGFQETTFIEQLVEDESQMEGLPVGCSKVMAWHLHLEAPHLIYPSGWRLEQNLPATISSQ